MKILLLDIETAPNKVYVWGLWDQNVGLNQIIEGGYTISWAAKWYGKDEIFFSSLNEDSKLSMLRKIHSLLDKADAVVHYNGIKFDIPTLNASFLIAGMAPPSPYKQIDLLRTVKSQLRLPSNKLDYVSKMLKIGQKIKTDFDLWKDVMNNVPKAWEDMKTYNIQDVYLLEKAYKRLLPWIPNHANHNLYSEGVHVCPNCGSEHLQKRGTYPTAFGLYQRYRCSTCKKWSRNRKKIAETVQIQGIA
jgi:DNA polymerase elongation subunit (family B)